MSITAAEAIQELWSDPQKKEVFLEDPKTYLVAKGESIPEDIQIVAFEDTLLKRHIVIPVPGTDVPPAEDPISVALSRAVNDPDYKAKILADPKGAAAEIGVEIPESMDIEVLQNMPDLIHVVLPFNPGDSELSDAELEAVAGGRGVNKPAACAGSSAGVGVACAGGCLAAAFFSFGTTSAAIAVGSAVGGGAAGTASALA